MKLDLVLKKAHTAYFYQLPKPLWKIINPIFGHLIRRLRMNIYDKKFSTLSLIRLIGEAVGTKEPLKVTVFGSEFEANYYGKLFFDKVESKIISEKQVPFSEMKNIIEKEKFISDIIAVHASENHCEEFWKAGFVVLPDEVQQEMKLTKDFSVIESRMTKILRTFPIFHELDRITIEQSKYPNDLSVFINKMYLPTIKNRFEDAGYLYPEEELEFFHKRGALFFIKNDGVLKTGMILSPQKDKLNAIAVGAVEGDKSILRTGYLPFMYLEALRYAHTKKYKIMNFGGSKTFLMDGVLRFKKDVGTSIVPSAPHPVINAFLLSSKKSLAAIRVFSRNAFISLINGKLYAVNIFVESNPPLKDVQHARKISLIPGLEKTIIIAPKFTEETKRFYQTDKKLVLIEEQDFSAYSKKIHSCV